MQRMSLAGKSYDEVFGDAGHGIRVEPLSWQDRVRLVRDQRKQRSRIDRARYATARLFRRLATRIEPT